MTVEMSKQMTKQSVKKMVGGGGGGGITSLLFQLLSFNSTKKENVLNSHVTVP